ncbi:MAG: bifunctional nuclease family protein [Spirochaetia bacterium]|jgi:bifunctional DNase/RNase|nr:bifunctional nuclease family protein [Spirochaetia bacterium]
MKEEMLRVRVEGVAMPSEDDMPVVLLKEDCGSGECCVAVGASEAGAILMGLQGLYTPRPLTHDLMALLFKEQGISIHRIELYGLYGSDEDGYLARMEYGKGLRTWVRDIRPSDALALAVATGAPVYAHASLMSHSDGSWLSEAKRA